VLQQQIAAVLEQRLADSCIPAGGPARATGPRLANLLTWSNHSDNINQSFD
jgi:hypothetical protein